MTLKAGDWVRSHGAGIWRVYRILDYKSSIGPSRREELRRLVFVARFVSNAFKRSFTEECCDEAFVRPLSSEDQDKLDEFIRSNPEVYRKFCDYLPRKLGCVYTAHIGKPPDLDAEAVTAMLSGGPELRDIDIRPHLEGLGLRAEGRPQWLVQYRSEDHACRDGYVMYDFLRVLAR